MGLETVGLETVGLETVGLIYGQYVTSALKRAPTISASDAASGRNLRMLGCLLNAEVDGQPPGARSILPVPVEKPTRS